jgi:discoidin domain receptor family member 2
MRPFFVNASRRLFLQTDRREQHFTPGRFTPLLLPEQTPAGAQESPVFEFPRHRLRLLEKLGEGAFGMVSFVMNFY